MNSTKRKQVFQTGDTKRWKRFQLTIAFVIGIFLLLIGSAIYSIKDEMSPNLPSIDDSTAFKKFTDTILVDDRTHDQFNIDLDKIRKKHLHNFYKSGFLEWTKAHHQPTIKFPVRAGFFVNWDVQSLYSLRQNASKMNMVLPEWMFVQDTSDEVFVDIDPKALHIMKQNRLAIVPMLTNNFNQIFNGKNVHRIITDKNRRTKFIKSVVAVLDSFHFQGVNIDFEDLIEKSDEAFVDFVRELSESLHDKGYIVTQDVSPFNEDYNYAELSPLNDLIFLMAYDQHNKGSNPGPIAAHEWMENALDEITQKMPQEKVVLGIAAFGYDWPEGYQGNDVTYQEAITNAEDNDSTIDYDNDNYNLNYSYTDDEGTVHKVFFTDAATNFNAIRAAEDFGTSGVAVWRLGSEDPRIWNFFSRKLSLDSLKKYPFNFKAISKVPVNDNIDYIGEGEVLNLLSAPQEGIINLEIDTDDQLISEQKFLSLPTNFVIQKSGNVGKKIVLTFDDGPDEDYTPRIVEILKKYKVPGAFFITGVNAIRNVPLLKKIYNDGYEIGNHTFTHVNLLISSDSRISLELRATRRLIESITHHSTILFRPPYDVDAEPTNVGQLHPLYLAKQRGYIYIGSAIDPRDWEEDISADSIFSRASEQRKLGNIILLHDAGGDREQTVKALPRIIEFYKKNGYQFVTLSEFLGMKKDELMPPVKGGLNTLFLFADNLLASYASVQDYFLSWLFFFSLILIFFRMTLIFLLVVFKKKKQKIISNKKSSVSVIIPAFNEEINAVKTIENILQSDYVNFEIIFVDDGSTDNTFEKINSVFSANKTVRIFQKINGGKASAINFGIENSTSEIIVCIDADTILAKDAISNLVIDFADEKVAAVAGNVKVGNEKNLLTLWQSIEYTTSQNFDRLAFETLNAIMVVPGAIGAFRRSAVIEVGGFSTDTLAEDCDITLKLLEKKYKIKTNNLALAFTESPETLKQFLKQRKRWCYGIMQSFWKHRKKLFNKKFPNMGFVVLPNILIYQLFLPLFSPIVDLTLLLSLFSGKAAIVLLLYLAYMAVDITISAIAYFIDNRKIPFIKLLLIIPQRIIYRMLLFYVLFVSFMNAIKGELVHWGILKRTGNVRTTNYEL